MVYRVTAELKLFNPNAMNVSDRKFSANVLKVASVVAGLTLWHLVAVYVINDSALLVSPIVVVKTTYEMLFVTGELYPHLFASSGIFFYGFVLAIIAGVPLGFVMALSPLVRDYVNPWMATLYTTPRIAFAPILLLWFGIGAGSKVAIVFLGCVFPILINSYYGMRVVNREYVELARSFRLRPWELFLKIMLPASLPFILSGIRLAIGPRSHRRCHRRVVWRYGGLGLSGLLRRSNAERTHPLCRCDDICGTRDRRLRIDPALRSICHAVAERSPRRMMWPGRF